MHHHTAYILRLRRQFYFCISYCVPATEATAVIRFWFCRYTPTDMKAQNVFAFSFSPPARRLPMIKMIFRFCTMIPCQFSFSASENCGAATWYSTFYCLPDLGVLVIWGSRLCLEYRQVSLLTTSPLFIPLAGSTHHSTPGSCLPWPSGRLRRFPCYELCPFSFPWYIANSDRWRIELYSVSLHDFTLKWFVWLYRPEKLIQGTDCWEGVYIVIELF